MTTWGDYRDGIMCDWPMMTEGDECDDINCG